MNEADAIVRVLTEHVETATLFCRACPDLTPIREELDGWETVGIRRHQAEQIVAALTRGASGLTS